MTLTRRAVSLGEAALLRERLEGGLRAGTEMLDHLGGRERAEARRTLVRRALRQAEQKTRREKIARTGRVDHVLDRTCRHGENLIARDHDAALLAARHDRQARLPAQCGERAVEIRRLVQAAQLGLVGEKQVDGAGAHEVEKLVAPAIDAKSIR